MDPSCEKCHQTPANHVHMLWSCTSLRNYWTAIFNTLLEETGTLIELNAITALFGTHRLPLPRPQADLTAFVIIGQTSNTNEMEITNTAFSHSVDKINFQ